MPPNRLPIDQKKARINERCTADTHRLNAPNKSLTKRVNNNCLVFTGKTIHVEEMRAVYMECMRGVCVCVCVCATAIAWDSTLKRASQQMTMHYSPVGTEIRMRKTITYIHPSGRAQKRMCNKHKMMKLNRNWMRSNTYTMYVWVCVCWQTVNKVRYNSIKIVTSQQ